jgi:hypothetical protein
MSNKKFHTRSFISFALFITIFWLLVTGTVLYISPPGRVAHWQHWTVFSFDKNQWQAQHTLFSYLFVVLAIIHIFTLNWRNLWSYIKIKSHAGFRKSKEFAVALTVMIIFFFGTAIDLPPFSSFYNLGEEIGLSWEERQLRAPNPHTENLSLEQVADEYLKMDIGEVLEKLKSNGVIVEGQTQTLGEIAISNGSSPSQIYSILSPPPLEGQGLGAGRGSGKGIGSGQGYGRMTINDLASDLNMDADDIISILKVNNIKAGKNETVREIADKYKLHPSEITQMIRDGAN